MRPRGNRFTIYDAMEKSGVFDSNPANTGARSPTDGSPLFKGPVQYPKMLYHPKGEERITVPAELIQTPMGPKAVGEQRELTWRIVADEKEHAQAELEGWHDHPSKAVRARVEQYIADNDLTADQQAALLKTIPAMSSGARIQELEAELARITQERDTEKKQREADQSRTKATVLAGKPAVPTATKPAADLSAL